MSLRKLLLLGILLLSFPGAAMADIGQPAMIMGYDSVTNAQCVVGKTATCALKTSGAASSGGAVYGPTAVGSAAANPPILTGGTADGTGTGNVSVWKIIAGLGQVQVAAALPAGTNAIGSITNTSFGISGTLPSFASQQTMTAQHQVYTGSAFTNMLSDASGHAQVVGTETAGSAVTGGGVRMMGSDGTNARDFLLGSSGVLFTGGNLTSGTSTTTQGALVMGFDGTNDRALLTTTGGQLNIAGYNSGQGALQAIGNVASGSTDSGAPVKVGGVYNTSPPSLTTGQRGDLQLNSSAQAEVQISQGSNSAAIGNVGSDGVSGTSGTLFTKSFGSVFNGTTWDRRYSIQAVNGTGLGVAAVAEAPHATNGTTGSACSAVCSNLVLKNSSGNLYSINVTTGATAGYIMFFNATSAPADGAVTPGYCSVIAANSTFNMANTPIPSLFTTGITVVFSTTGCYTKTASATAFIEGQIQ